MQKILFVKHNDSTFILTDQEILQNQYKVIPYLMKNKRTGWPFLVQMLKLCVFLICNIKNTKAIVTWFGDYHSAILSLFGKVFCIKVIIFAGGQEAICYPELRKGVYYKKWRGSCVKFALSNATHIIPNHDSLIYHTNFYYSKDGKKDGIKYYNPGIKTPITTLPNGIKTDKYFHNPEIQKDPNGVLTVGNMHSTTDFINKGFDLFTEMARRNPDLNFTIISIKKPFLSWAIEHFRINEIPNLEVINTFCSDELLIQKYNSASVFVQASIAEGMPNTLNEAMLCECVPVGSNVNGIPDAIGNTGIIINNRNVEELEDAVRKALKMDTGLQARQYVLDNFTFEIREKKLLALFSDILGNDIKT